MRRLGVARRRCGGAAGTRWLARASPPRPPLSLEYSRDVHRRARRMGSRMARPGDQRRGEVIAYVGSIQDVTDLARSEARLRQVAEDPSNAIVRIDRAGKITYVSSIFRMLGFPGAQHTGLQMHTIIHPDDLHLFADRDSLFENPDEIRQRRFRAVTRDGAIMWFDAHSHGAVDPITGVVNEIQSSLRDVTEQVEAEQALRESEERFRVLAEAAAEGVCISDSDQIVSANLAFSNMYGYAPDEVVRNAHRVTRGRRRTRHRAHAQRRGRRGERRVLRAPQGRHALPCVREQSHHHVPRAFRAGHRDHRSHGVEAQPRPRGTSPGRPRPPRRARPRAVVHREQDEDGNPHRSIGRSARRASPARRIARSTKLVARSLCSRPATRRRCRWRSHRRRKTCASARSWRSPWK